MGAKLSLFWDNLTLQKGYTETRFRGCSCGCTPFAILKKTTTAWTIEEVKERSKNDNHPLVHAIMFHDLQTLRELLSKGNIDVKTAKFNCVRYSFSENDKSLICYRRQKMLLLDIAFIFVSPGFGYSAEIIDFLLSFRGQLDWFYQSWIHYAGASLIKELLLLGSLRTKNITEIKYSRRQHEMWIMNENGIPSPKEKEISDIINLWSDELLLLYCFDKKLGDHIFFF